MISSLTGQREKGQGGEHKLGIYLTRKVVLRKIIVMAMTISRRIIIARERIITPTPMTIIITIVLVMTMTIIIIIIIAETFICVEYDRR